MNGKPITLSITLNNFLHRIDSKTVMINLINQHNCDINRIRRSKHWLLTGQLNQLIEIRDHLQTGKVSWIAKAIDNTLPKPTFDLAQMISAFPTITVNQLVTKTGCSVIEARHAIDTAEGFND